MEKISNSSVNKFTKALKKIFKKLVPRGLIEIKVVDVPSLITQDTENTTLAKGISLKASFGGDAFDNSAVQMENLSSGQKTVIAICILFAFQELYPASFYCLDEISADLDSHYVEKVAEM